MSSSFFIFFDFFRFFSFSLVNDNFGRYFLCNLTIINRYAELEHIIYYNEGFFSSQDNRRKRAQSFATRLRAQCRVTVGVVQC